MIEILRKNDQYVSVKLTYWLKMQRNLRVDPQLITLLNQAPGPELDYGFVMNCLKDYKNPRVKLNHLLKIGALVRIKKGIYILGKDFTKNPYVPEVLANIIYGPSYVSLEWACQYYRLIPERVTTVTSVTSQRSKAFQTPIGLFTYNHLPIQNFMAGVTLVQFSETQRALFATKEKALADLLVLRRGRFASKKHLEETLFEDLRIEKEDIQNLDLDLLKNIYEARPHSAIKYLIQCRKS